jgi:hypothetical protein
MPYFFLCRQLNTTEQKRQAFNQLLGLYAKSLERYPEYSRYFLYITYFCISDNYECLDNRSLEIMLRLIDLSSDIVSACISQMSLEHILYKKLDIPEKMKIMLKMPSKSFYQVVQADWKELWASLQSFSRFWAHPDFKFQRDRPFDPADYVYNPHSKLLYQWSISNFITK